MLSPKYDKMIALMTIKITLSHSVSIDSNKM